MGRAAKELMVTVADRAQLEAIARSQSLPAALSRRAQMILRMSDGESNSAVARRYRVSRPTVSFWRTRFHERGIAGLHNELKPGRPRSTSEEQIAALVNTAVKRKPEGKTHWSRRGLAAKTGLSKSTVHRYLTLFGLQPHRSARIRLAEGQSGFLLCCRLARFPERRPIRRVLERLVVFRQRLSRATLLH